MVLKVKELLYDRGFTIPGARKHLSRNRAPQGSERDKMLIHVREQLRYLDFAPAENLKWGHRDVAQPGSAHAWGACGRRYKSSRPDFFVPAMKPLILVTNDDGIQSPAFEAVEDALADLGHVSVVAPDREMSATSQCITLNQPLRFQQLAPNRFAVQGTPSDCVILASLRILRVKPALVISGVNRGANVGDDISYSGTVAAAFEAALQGIPAIAISTYARQNPDFTPAARVAARLAAKVLEDGLPPNGIS